MSTIGLHPDRCGTWPASVLGAAWLVVLALAVGMPYATASATLGDDLTRYTIRHALLFYFVAAGLMLRLRGEDWSCATGRGRTARWCWTLAWGAYMIHLAMAFHHYHGWSHAHAVQHVEDRSGFGPGIYFSHLFTIVWSVDVLTWWLRPRSYAARSAWIDRALHGFMVFIIFNATVVYEQGPIRWAGAVMLATLAILWYARRFQTPQAAD